MAAYDAAAWHGTDALIALQPQPSGFDRYLARQRPDDGLWEVVFGMLTPTRDTFLIVYRAVQITAGDTLYTATRLASEEADTGYYASAARAWALAEGDFGQPSRPYNTIVIPFGETREWFVYFVPAPTRFGYWPFGADVRYHIASRGDSLIAKRRLHNAILEYGPMGSVREGIHTAVLDDTPEDSDVFIVLTRRPLVQEYVVSDGHIFHIDTDGTISVIERGTRPP